MPATFSFAEKWLQLKTVLSRPPCQLAALLLFVYLGAVLLGGVTILGEFLRMGGLIGGYLLTYVVLQKWKPTRVFPWTNTIITFALLGMILEPTGIWWRMAIIGGALALAKRWLRWKQLPVVNYTVFAMVVGYFVNVLPYWWGVSFAPRLTSLQIPWAALVFVPVGLYFAFLYKKLPAVAMMLGIFTSLSWVLSHQFPSLILADATVLFFALIMMVEPKTSPTIRSEQLVFGAVVGALLALGFARGWIYPYETALLSGNVGYVGWKWWKMRPMAL
jgi:Na+-translocating ferredoxin:NAD+ oxidoreductase RnfD subunit